ncbi:hypothetical protein [Acinetobacter phage vB_AbaM_IME284]|nr:hypothetical protein [Acinetobacter phage vB_AbaM_IME284]
MAENIVESMIVKLGLDGSQYNREAEKAKSNNDKLNKSVSETDKVVGNVTKTLARWFSVAATATGILRMVDQVQKLNDELYHLERNLGMSASTIKNWQGAAGAMGGSAQGMTESIKSLNMGMNDFVTMGDTTLLPFMNALGVGMVDAQGKLRKTDDVMLDLADSFSKMDREQAFSIASKMGIDEGTFNTLVQGRKEMEKMLEYQSKMYKSSEEELKASRQLAQNRALLGQHWESLKTMMANAIIPLFVKLSEVALGIFEYLQENQQAVQAVFKGISFVIGAILIPILAKATVAALAFIAPFAPFILVVGALGAAFGLLYDDYKTWAEGGKSLFDWGAFRKYIDDSTLSTDNLKNAFKNLTKEIMSSAMPTLQGYAEVIQKLLSGDFRGAGAQAWAMIKQFGANVAGVVDDLTGQAQGTLANAVGNLVNPNTPTSSAPSIAGATSKGGNAILDLIAKGEVGTTEASGYNVAYRGARISAQQKFGKDLSQLTIGQVKELQKANLNEQKSRGIPANRRSSAMGRYQFIYSGFDDYIRAAGLSDKDMFSPENQDAMAMAILSKGKYGLNAVRAGKATPEQFQNNVLAARWASIQKTTGGGVHDAAGFNKATIGNQAVAAALQSTRQGDFIDLTKARQNQATANKANEVQVNVGDINIQTSSSTVTGNVQDAMGAIKDQFYQFRNSFN